MNNGTDEKKRRTLKLLTGVVAGAGVLAVAVPFTRSLKPGPRQESPNQDIDISELKEGQVLSVYWKSKPLYILRRKQEDIDRLRRKNHDLLDPESEASRQPEGAKNLLRSLRPDVFVAFSICTHRGCGISYQRPGDDAKYDSGLENGSFSCPCHGAVFDLSGRVYKHLPARRNLDIPDYRFLDENTVRIGEV